MPGFIGQDRNGRVVEIHERWPELLPITVQEAELLKAVREVEDLRLRRELEPNWDREMEERLEAAIKIALELVQRY